MRFLFVVLAPTGCGAGESMQPLPGATTFESMNPNAGIYAAVNYSDASGGGDGAGWSGEAGSTGIPEADAAREIVEADILQLEGDRLYALSRHRGLSIIDLSQPDAPRVLGQYGVIGEPFEFYLRDEVALVLFTGTWTDIDSAGGGEPGSFTAGRLMALDVANPAAIRGLGVHALEGDIVDSRIVGDVLYVVTYRRGSCQGCSAFMSVSSLDVRDPHAVRMVDEIEFPDTSWGDHRAVASSPDRLYVASREYEGSSVQVIDISDPAGALLRGADVPVNAPVGARWQMDEFEGVLRVATQQGIEAPVIETFQIVSSEDVLPLGVIELQLPFPEDFKSVRFDGPRGYVVTVQHIEEQYIDPLFVVDLGDPGAPRQRGAIEFPGWLYHVEPRGDRLVALGYDELGSANLSVSLFDVADPDTPRELARVHFGGPSGDMPEHQNRVQKALRILPELNLILMPYSDSAGQGGIQLIDFAGDTLTLRGVAAHRGFARRAFVHRNRLFALSDERLDAFDIAERDRPVQTATVAFARNIEKTLPLGDVVVQFDPGDSLAPPRLDVAASRTPGALEPLGSVDLSASLAAATNGARATVDRAQLFGTGSRVFIALTSAMPGPTGRSTFVSVDVTTPEAPRVEASSSHLFFLPQTVLQAGSTLVAETGGRLQVIDMSRPAAPLLAAQVVRPGAQWHGSPQLSGSVVGLSHFAASAGRAGHGRYYFDRVDVARAAEPQSRERLNIPGMPVGFDAEAGWLVTLDYQPRPYHPYDERCEPNDEDQRVWRDETSGECFEIEESLNLLSLGDTVATLRARRVFPEGQDCLSATLVGDLLLYSWRDLASYQVQTTLVTGLGAGRLSERGSIPTVAPIVAARGRYVVFRMAGDSGLNWLAVYDVADPDHPALQKRVPLPGSSYADPDGALTDLAVADDALWLSYGLSGVQRVPFVDER